jgi:alpha-glucosidase (family GH31 glycosyl hydrolase)
LAKNH